MDQAVRRLHRTMSRPVGARHAGTGEDTPGSSASAWSRRSAADRPAQLSLVDETRRPLSGRRLRARLRILACLACLLAGGLASAPSSVAAPARGAEPSPGREWVTPDLVVRELQPGVWLHRSWGRDATGERTPSNGLVVRDDAGLVIIDTPWGNAPSEALLDWIARELNEPVLGVIITHSHDDRMGGARVMREHAIPLLAAPRTVEIAATRSVENLPTALAGLDEGKAVPVGALEVFNPGPAHSPDNVVVWLPAQRLLFGGCVVKSADATSLGFTGDANLARWPEALRRVKQRYRDAVTVVPGHGDPGGKNLLDRTRLLLARRAATGKPATPQSPRMTPEPPPTPTVDPTPEEPAAFLPEEVPAETASPAPRVLLPAEEPR
jgi:glyoxylase-like metal-dependent hydrolase (beta-lactamase superfamily II)